MRDRKRGTHMIGNIKLHEQPWPDTCWDCEHRHEDQCDLKDKDLVEDNDMCDEFKQDELLAE